ncbi:ATG16-domain-containing protein [Exidia glandulosa HHB12029]|uniref:ATG16-domain-containing protein n=1 Tax=Exidia glandulosa HHB12029 TaxID=1314781 RepID=A0A165PF85_EXIGL|nr:ATG16-domain-containing protein [Exidia glandulosa HHB12029]
MQAGPSSMNTFQDVIRQRLVDRNEREHAYASIIEQYRRLAQQTRLLKERNQNLLRAVGTVKSNPNASTVLVGAEDNPVRAAYTASLEQQVSSMRDELAAAYKAQSQATQRLIAVNDTQRAHEEQARADADQIRKLQDELTILRRKVAQHNEILSEKDKTVQNLNDDLTALTLEIGQLEQRNADLRKDNASLLSRWIDKMNLEADKLNEANVYYEELKTAHDTQLGDLPSSGNGVANGTSRNTTGKSPATGSTSSGPFQSLNPNG